MKTYTLYVTNNVILSSRIHHLDPRRRNKTIKLFFKFKTYILSCLKDDMEHQFQVIIIYTVKVILNVKCSTGDRLSSCEAPQTTN